MMFWTMWMLLFGQWTVNPFNTLRSKEEARQRERD
jgi:hypothetical protein